VPLFGSNPAGALGRKAQDSLSGGRAGKNSKGAGIMVIELFVGNLQGRFIEEDNLTGLIQGKGVEIPGPSIIQSCAFS